MRYLFVLPLVITLSACTQTQTPPVGDWIDIPLTEHTFSEGSVPYRTGTYEIPLYPYEALEYKLGMKEGDTVVYEWTVSMNDPDLLEVEFHGHTERTGNEPGLLMFYKIHNEGQESGVLTAPFSGIHGWYLNNQTDEDIVVHLAVSGFYTELEQ